MKRKCSLFRWAAGWLSALAVLAGIYTARAQGTMFTYQGRLNNGASPANGQYDLSFTLFDAATNGNPVGSPLTNSATSVSNGLFTVTLDFGAGVFTGADRWLEIGVRTNGGGAFATLVPRQQLTATPYAVTAGAVTGPVNGSSIVNGSITGAQLASGAATANLNTDGQSGVSSGGVILSMDANSSALVAAGFVKIGETVTSDFWKQRSNANAPIARYYHTAVWTGAEMMVWGGAGGGNTGGRYDPANDSWTATSLVNTPTVGDAPKAVWTGAEMIVWGGQAASNGSYPITGGRYDPGNDIWTAMSTTGAPAGRTGHTTVWTGTEMIVWGGKNSVNPGGLNTGGRYTPGGDWIPTTTTGAPSARFNHTAVWTGTDMIIWGGTSSNTGGHFDPTLTNGWAATSTVNAPVDRSFHTAVWTDREMLVFGGTGLSVSGLVSNTLFAYTPPRSLFLYQRL